MRMSLFTFVAVGLWIGRLSSVEMAGDYMRLK